MAVLCRIRNTMKKLIDFIFSNILFPLCTQIKIYPVCLKIGKKYNRFLIKVSIKISDHQE